MYKKNRSSLTRTIIGLVLVVVGVAMLLEFQNIVDIGPLWRYWPVILIGVGALKFFQAFDRDEQGGGIVMVLIGSWLLISIQHYWDLSFHETWPAVFVAIGISLLWKALPPMKLDKPEDPING
jgi:hypothetical protein